MGRGPLVPFLVPLVLFATVLLPTVQAQVSSVSVVTDRTDYVVGMAVSATATIVYSGPFGQVNGPARVEWRNATWVLERSEDVPKNRINDNIMEVTAVWTPPNPGLYYVNVTTTASNVNSSLVTGSATFRVSPSTPAGGSLLLLGLLAAIVLGAVLAAAVLVWRRRSRGEPPAPQKPPPSQAPAAPLNPSAGRSYAILAGSPDAAFEVLAGGVRGGVPGLCITRLRPEDARDRYGLEGVPLYWLTRSFGPEALNPTNLGAIVDLVRRSAKSPGFRVVLDGVEYLYTQNDFAKVAKFVQALADVIAEQKAVLLIPIDPRSLDPDRLAVLTRDLQRWP